MQEQIVPTPDPIERSARFQRTERILFRIYLSLAAWSGVMLAMLYLFSDWIAAAAEILSQTVLLLTTVVVGLFVTSIVRIILFIAKLRHLIEPPRIWRSVVTFFTAPVVATIYYVILLVLLLSMASCTYSG